MFVKFAQGKKLKEMKSLTLTVLSKRIGLVMVLCCPIVIIGLDLQEECRQTEDGHVTRGNFTCCASSPESVPLQLSINFESGWKKCAVEPGSLNEDPVISSWRVYRCIIFQGIYGKPLLPTTFTNFYAAKYPPSIKSQIFHRMSELENGDMKFEADVECLKRTPYPKVHLLRNLFFDVEQDVCEAGNNQTLQSDLDTATRNRYASSSYVQRTSAISPDLAAILCETCDRTKAMYHRNGDCCSHVPIPFPFMFLPYRYGNNERVNRCAEDLADDVGLPADSEFSTHLQYLCYPSCEFYLSGVLDETDLWAGVTILQSQSEIRNLVMKMMPKYLSSKYKQNILHYVLENFKGAWAETKTFEDRIRLSHQDNRTLNKGKLRDLLASCKTHRLIETISTLYLNNMCLELYPLNERNESTTPKSFVFAFNSTTTPASTVVGNDDVMLNFDWGTPNHNHDREQHHHHQHHHHSFEGTNEAKDDYGGNSFWDFRNRSSGSGPKWEWSSTTPSSRRQYIRVY